MILNLHSSPSDLFEPWDLITWPCKWSSMLYYLSKQGSSTLFYGSRKRRKIHQIWRMQILSLSSRKTEVFVETTVKSISCPSRGRSLPGSFSVASWSCQKTSSREYMHYRLTINMAKTKVLLQPCLGHQPPPGVKTTINRLDPKNVEQFPYLDSVLMSNASTEKDVNNRIKATRATYRKLFKRVFSNPGLTQTTKFMVYWAVVILTLLYACEM